MFEYKLEEVGMESLRLVQEIIQALCEDKITITFFEALQKVNTVHLKYNEGPTTSMIIDAARKRNIPVNTGPAGFTILGHGKIRKRSVQRFPN
ncbi:hypothetical protein [Chryseobacterium formosense]|uniref:hypothetical protein n=1 Tax=Chryseobacterium formosense TaxID=236814 RepID=UPI0011608B57|nr:hypothetical protein [Chryseobacterium formosense]